MMTSSLTMGIDGIQLMKMSGRGLCILNMLLGVDLVNRKSLKIPFPHMHFIRDVSPYMNIEFNKTVKHILDREHV